ncbi:MAG: YqeG family HAD IIIA-type phosphatase [Syntrophomonadaceae bacterium]|jgi:HAD superfamily phosphatase (TIGR01668 family)|nr:YqeG family HAD IIIA-type phosphatase [Syntrophomonadaceae bacterium]
MRSFWYPKMYVKDLLSIPMEILPQNNIKGIILDLDNTVTEWNSNYIRPQVAQWFAELKSRAVQLCILSNNGEERVVKVAEQLNVPYVHRARKPTSYGYLRALKIMGLQAENTLLIGDQIFTDIWGGNRLGLFTVLVKPLNGKEFPGTKVSRFFERILLKKIVSSQLVDVRV